MSHLSPPCLLIRKGWGHLKPLRKCYVQRLVSYPFLSIHLLLEFFFCCTCTFFKAPLLKSLPMDCFFAVDFEEWCSEEWFPAELRFFFLWCLLYPKMDVISILNHVTGLVLWSVCPAPECIWSKSWPLKCIDWPWEKFSGIVVSQVYGQLALECLSCCKITSVKKFKRSGWESRFHHCHCDLTLLSL